MELIGHILDAIALRESDTPRAALACEDAHVAYMVGYVAGLTPKQIAAQHTTLIGEMCEAPGPADQER